MSKSETLLPCPFCGGETRDAHTNHTGDCFFADVQRTEAERIFAWNTRQAPPKGWRPIESAPKDRIVLLFGVIDPLESQRDLYSNLDKPVRATGYWDEIDAAWCPVGSTWEGPWINPTHWADLPEPPAEGEG